ncbi:MULTISPECIES: LacI family DNA-binding transcriptional regulator [unclassified Rhizobium]|uniref:LacI family DNA-binding transcriptional regulator n=1 Tax=unclassified Rhizobium TaxID=2613769 RepID=UPI001AD97502|nr:MULTISPECIES: LacI family DNA-binding transcriptional regulator [unclassified Rhizobium]MBO9123788.1 LacI family DNA-binding transcriptional regulator [Rhizobium sp. 16-488-2b]MBO9174320.1 LacI family DNA-binding transcriptional regulator [Rhizobium sp. 16-488-2a]
MRRPTIRDVATRAGVSIATTNRVLAGSDSVSPKTRAKVREAAEAIGFYGLGAIAARNNAARPRYRFGVILLQPHRPFYQLVARALLDAAQAQEAFDIELRVEHLDDLSPQNTAERALSLASECDAISITTAVHPVVTKAIEEIQARGIPVFALISQLAATGQIHYIGLDHWKVGRTAAWAVHNICKSPGKIALLVGNPRFRNQEMNETGFRSYFREHGSDFTLLEPLSTFESSAVAEEMTERLLSDHADLAALYVAGGGISGVLAALRTTGRAGTLVVVGYELMDNVRSALLDGALTLSISHPLAQLASEAISGMISAVASKEANPSYTKIVPFNLYTRENV